MNHPTSNPYESRPTPDGYLTYQIIPIPEHVVIEKDVMVAMPDGVRLACNVYRPDKTGRFPVILGMTPYGKDKTPPSTAPTALSLRTHIQTMSTGFRRAGSVSATRRYPCLPPSNTRTLSSGCRTGMRSLSRTKEAASSPKESGRPPSRGATTCFTLSNGRQARRGATGTWEW